MSATPDGIYRVESDPGEDEAYGAPTKVGPMSKAAIDKLMRDAEVSAVSAPSSGLRPRVAASEPPAEQQPVPVLFDEQEEGLEPTRLTSRTDAPSAKSVAILTRGASAIVAELRAEAGEEAGEKPAAPSAPAQPVVEAAPFAPPAPAFPPPPNFAFPEWVAGPPDYALAPPRPNAMLSDRAFVLAIVACVIGFIMFAVPFLWWLFH